MSFDEAKRARAAAFEQAVLQLSGLRELESTLPPSAATHRALWELTKWATSELYSLEIINVSPGEYWPGAKGWRQIGPLPYGQTEVVVTVRLINNSTSSISGKVTGFVNGQVILAHPHDNEVDALAPGASWEGSVYFYGRPTGTHRLTVTMVSDEATGAFGLYDPATGRFRSEETHPTLAVAEAPYFVGNQSEVRAMINQYLGINIRGDVGLPLRADAIDSDGVARHLTFFLCWICTTTMVWASSSLEEMHPVLPARPSPPNHRVPACTLMVVQSVFGVSPAPEPAFFSIDQGSVVNL